MTHHPLEFGYSEGVDILMRIVETLAAHTLQHQMTVVSNRFAQTVAPEGVVLPLLLMILHP